MKHLYHNAYVYQDANLKPVFDMHALRGKCEGCMKHGVGKIPTMTQVIKPKIINMRFVEIFITEEKTSVLQ